MPGILSRDAYLYRRRSSSIKSSTSSKSSGSSWASSWGSLWDNQTPPISRTPLAGNSTLQCIIDRGHLQLPFAGRSRRVSKGDNDVIDEIHQQPQYHKESRNDQDSWGQFIDTAEAEDEMVRHSKILSKRYAARGHGPRQRW
jgi:hypothetical protein